jgi:hypothetical protein
MFGLNNYGCSGVAGDGLLCWSGSDAIERRDLMLPSKMIVHEVDEESIGCRVYGADHRSEVAHPNNFCSQSVKGGSTSSGYESPTGPGE